MSSNCLLNDFHYFQRTPYLLQNTSCCFLLGNDRDHCRRLPIFHPKNSKLLSTKSYTTIQRSVYFVQNISSCCLQSGLHHAPRPPCIVQTLETGVSPYHVKQLLIKRFTACQRSLYYLYISCCCL
jgi:hypothetical protein